MASRTVEHSRLMGVVSPAQHADVVRGRLAPDAIRIHMVELKEALFPASMAIWSHPGAPITVSRAHVSTHGGGDVPRTARLSPRGARLAGRPDLPPFALPHEQPQRSVEDRIQVPKGDGVAEQVLRPAKQRMRFRARGEPNFVAPGCERTYDGARRRRDFDIHGHVIPRRLVTPGPYRSDNSINNAMSASSFVLPARAIRFRGGEAKQSGPLSTRHGRSR